MARSRLTFGDMHVRDVMIPDPPRVRGWLSVDTFLREEGPHVTGPVAVVERFDGTIAGLVSVDQLRVAPAFEGTMRRVQDFAVPLSSIRVAHPDDLLADIAARPVRGRSPYTLVYDGDDLIGLVPPEAFTSSQAVSRATP